MVVLAGIDNCEISLSGEGRFAEISNYHRTYMVLTQWRRQWPRQSSFHWKQGWRLVGRNGGFWLNYHVWRRLCSCTKCVFRTNSNWLRSIGLWQEITSPRGDRRAIRSRSNIIKRVLTSTEIAWAQSEFSSHPTKRSFSWHAFHSLEETATTGLISWCKLIT